MRLRAALDSQPVSGDSAGLLVNELDRSDYQGGQRSACPNEISIGTTESSKAYRTPYASILLDFEAPACRRLISRVSHHEVVSLIETIFASQDEVKMISCLRGDDAQTFIDIIHEVHPPPSLISNPRSNYICSLSGFRLPFTRLWISPISNRDSGRSA